MPLKEISIYDIYSFYNPDFCSRFYAKKNLHKGDIIFRVKNSKFLPFS